MRLAHVQQGYTDGFNADNLSDFAIDCNRVYTQSKIHQIPLHPQKKKWRTETICAPWLGDIEGGCQRTKIPHKAAMSVQTTSPLMLANCWRAPSF